MGRSTSTAMISTMVKTPRSFAAIQLAEMISMNPMMWATISAPQIDPIPPTITTATAMISGPTHMPG